MMPGPESDARFVDGIERLKPMAALIRFLPETPPDKGVRHTEACPFG